MDTNNKIKKIGILTFEKYQQKRNIGSSRIRARWVWEQINKLYPEQYQAEEFITGKKYDVVVFQKSYWVEYAKHFKGFKILDLCDPDWMHWAYSVKEMIDEVDVITCSSQAIANYIKNLTNKKIIVIPDRLNLSLYTQTKKHRGDLKTVAWFGYSHNFPALTYAIKALDNRKLNLIVISDGTYSVPVGINNVEVTNFKWTEATVNNDLLRADAVLNPKYLKGRFKYKSDNKTVNAWALGLPVLQSDDDFDTFKTEEARNAFAKEILNVILANYDVSESAKQIVGIIEEYGKNPQGNN